MIASVSTFSRSMGATMPWWMVNLSMIGVRWEGWARRSVGGTPDGRAGLFQAGADGTPHGLTAFDGLVDHGVGGFGHFVLDDDGVLADALGGMAAARRQHEGAGGQGQAVRQVGVHHALHRGSMVRCPGDAQAMVRTSTKWPWMAAAA